MDSTLEPQSDLYLLQKVAVAVQRGNTAAILGFSYADVFREPFLPL